MLVLTMPNLHDPPEERIPPSSTKFVGINLNKQKGACVDLCNKMMKDDIPFALIQECNTYQSNGRHLITSLMPGFKAVHAESTTRFKAAIIAKPECSVMQMDHLCDMNTAAAVIGLNGKEVLLVSAYFHPSCPIPECLPALNKVLSGAGNMPVIMHLDSNARNALWHDTNSNVRGSALADWIICQGLFCLNEPGSDPTFCHKGTGHHSWIDITICNKPAIGLVGLWKVDSEIPTSDHRYVVFELNLIPALNQFFSTRRYRSSKADWNAFDQFLNSDGRCDRSLEDSASAEAIERATRSEMDLIKSACDRSMPRFAPTQRKQKYRWWDAECGAARAQVRKLAWAFRQLDGTAKTDARTLLLKAEHELHSLYNRKMKDSYRKWTGGAVGNQLYDIFKAVSTSRKPVPKNVLRDDGCWTTSDQESAEALFGQFFPTGGERGFHNRPQLDPQRDNVVLSKEQLENRLCKLAAKKSPGPDGLSGDIVKRAIQVRFEPWRMLLQACLRTGNFPSIWKNGVVRAIPKPGSAAFRPITLLDVAGKILDSLLAKEILDHVQSTGQLCQSQYGFLPGRSTVQALADLSEHIHIAKSNGESSLLVSFDISKAFDNARWEDICDELHTLNVRPGLILLVQSYFSNRSVILPFGKGRAEGQLTRGCPQGSCSGPVFWIILLNRLLTDLEASHRVNLRVFAYADDIMVVINGKTTEYLNRKAEAVIADILHWGEARGLQFNATKTQAMLVRAGNQIGNPLVSVHGRTIPLDLKMKYLGIYLDHMWRWQPHIKYACDKARSKLATCYRIAGNLWGLSFWMRKRLYLSIFLPTLTYAAAAWYGSLKWNANIAKLESAQRAALIWVCCSYSSISKAQALLLANEPPIEWVIRRARGLYQVKTRKPTSLPKTRALYEKLRLEAMDALQTNALIRLVGLLDESCREDLVNYWSAQFLTGHGGFASYLHRRKLTDDPACRFCVNRPAEEPRHILASCEQFDDLREELLEDSAIHDALCGDQAMLNRQEARQFAAFCEAVLDPSSSRRIDFSVRLRPRM